MDRNRLGEETSPYLLQHKDNPVHWQPWGAETLAAAKAQDKPILLSIGYAACHWCHVMAHESFENPEIAARMNELFVNIKVDREERPDLDAIYQHALALMGEQGGWPLTMFLTPDGEPFWGGTYFPPEQRWGRPGFAQVLEAMSNAYAQKRDDVAKNVVALREALQKLGRPERGGGIGRDMRDRIAERLLRESDQLHGGIGTAPKFPQTGVLELLWRAWRRRQFAICCARSAWWFTPPCPTQVRNIWRRMWICGGAAPSTAIRARRRMRGTTGATAPGSLAWQALPNSHVVSGPLG